MACLTKEKAQELQLWALFGSRSDKVDAVSDHGYKPECV